RGRFVIRKAPQFPRTPTSWQRTVRLPTTRPRRPRAFPTPPGHAESTDETIVDLKGIMTGVGLCPPRRLRDLTPANRKTATFPHRIDEKSGISLVDRSVPLITGCRGPSQIRLFSSRADFLQAPSLRAAGPAGLRRGRSPVPGTCRLDGDNSLICHGLRWARQCPDRRADGGPDEDQPEPSPVRERAAQDRGCQAQGRVAVDGRPAGPGTDPQWRPDGPAG